MKNQTHTPGPWKVATANDYSGIIVETSGPVRDRIAICTMEWDETESFNSDVHDETKANARLVASAPQLLSALAAIAAIAESGTIARHETNKPTWYATKEISSLARAAIAAAQGEKEVA